MLTYNVKINTKDEQYLKDTLTDITKCYDFISNIIFNDRENLGLKAIHKLTYEPARKQFPKLPAQIIVRTYKIVASNYKTVKQNKHQITKPLTMKNGSVRLDKRLYSKLTQNSIQLFSSTKNIRCEATFVLYDKVKDLIKKYNVTDPLLFIRDNELYLSLSFNVPSPLPHNDNALGIDRGIRRLVATSDGLVIKGSEFQHHKRKHAYNKRQLQKNGSKSAKRKLKKLKKKDRNFSNNYTHLVANEVLKSDKGILVLENLKNIKQKTSKHKGGNVKRTSHNRSFSQIPLFKLLEILTYKAAHSGKSVITVSPYKTSQNDCRGLSNGTRLGCRYYCTDGVQLDSDVNASVNIVNRFSNNHPISQYPKDICFVGRLFCQPANSSQPKKVEQQATKSLV